MSDPVETATMFEKTAFQYGVLGVLTVLFGLVIRFLYRENRADQKAIEVERKSFSVEREALKAEHAKISEALKLDYEKKHREVLEGYVHQLIQVRDSSSKREDDIRRETTALIEKLSESSQDSNEALVAMLQKFYEKIVKS